jgi:fructose-specific phosphotransferase system IIC component
MVDVVVLLIIIATAVGAFSKIGMEGLIAVLIGGAAGYAIGSTRNMGWSIYGAVLGSLIAGYLAYRLKAR